ncbi:hypothetical protein [Limnoraphis robusta]|uniref:Uncharacterized protein n=1 Tax=Limnoraphis robusta CCNP1315 TaxID=3110306 RepID=A0ABU5TZX8_9CYAN|nr:hypothetical protein [Limnoraphis robusta]MEA5520454.1 hypothetical protein [Limnoraphis robusta CCNP1315]MEA5546611.1 hypothetical protein [Limnoraphis robusta CCNP1324]
MLMAICVKESDRLLLKAPLLKQGRFILGSKMRSPNLKSLSL